MRFLAPVRVKALGVLLGLATYLALVVFFGYIAFPTSRAQKTKPVSFLNDRVRDIIGATAVNAPGFIVPGGLSGEGQIVAIADSGLDTGRLEDIHPDLQNTPGKMPKIISLLSLAGREVADDPDGHGTHMAATIAGTGAASNGKFRGVAPDASIYFQAILNKNGKPELPANLADLFLPAYLAGARVHVDGWGGGSNEYSESAVQVDDFVRNHRDFLVVFGAGNDGPSPGTVTAEANSKNALSVGASILPRPAFVPGPDNTALPAVFSSRGSSGDGRIKPELLAPASAVISARSSLIEGNLTGYPEYTRMQGTSMAAAVAGGASALLREYFKKYYGKDSPSAALLKAALVNGARPAGSSPSKEGFGVIDLAGTVIALEESSFRLADDMDGVSQGEEKSYTFKITDSTAPFKATLAWTDPPAEPGSEQSLINDLDLVVQAPDGKIYYGNNFLGTNAPDRTNNVEQVYLQAPITGEYTIRVSGMKIKQNTVPGRTASVQDFALVWGQAPAESLVEKAAGYSFVLAGGKSISLAGMSIRNLINDSVAPADLSHIYPGAAVFQTPQRTYLAARLWQAAGVKSLKTSEGTVLTEINPTTKLGGYSLAAGTGSLMLNNQPIENPYNPDDLPPGVEISAVVNPLDQKIRQVSAAYIEREGTISQEYDESGQKIIYLADDPRVYRVSRDAVYSYEDSYVNSEVEDIPFGAGALEELDKVLPGMTVRLRLAPSSGEVQYLAIKRQVLVGTVRETAVSGGKVIMENGASFRLLPGAPVKRDKGNSSLNLIKPGDYAFVILLPGTDQAAGIIAYSKTIYGKSVDFTKKDRTLYLLDTDSRYKSFYLPPDAVVYHWGVKATADAVSAGSLVKVTTSPDGKDVWRVDIADAFEAQGVVAGYDSATKVITTTDGEQYHVSGLTQFYKNGFPVLPEDILPGEQVGVEYAVASPVGNVLVSVSANSTAPQPLLLISALPLQGQLVVSGRTGANMSIIIWKKGNPGQVVPVDSAGRFSYSLQQDSVEGYKFTLVAVDLRTGGVAGLLTVLPGSGEDAGASVSSVVYNIITQVQSGVLPEGSDKGYSPYTFLSRAAAAITLSRLLNWPGTSSWPIPFIDTQDFPDAARSAVAEARARGVLKGYPDGRFLPENALSRAEAAVTLAAVLNELGLEAVNDKRLQYSDAGDIPSWAAGAVAETTAAGLFRGYPDGTFEPTASITAGEMEVILNRLLEFYQNRLEKDR